MRAVVSPGCECSASAKFWSIAQPFFFGSAKSERFTFFSHFMGTKKAYSLKQWRPASFPSNIRCAVGSPPEKLVIWVTVLPLVSQAYSQYYRHFFSIIPISGIVHRAEKAYEWLPLRYSDTSIYISVPVLIASPIVFRAASNCYSVLLRNSFLNALHLLYQNTRWRLVLFLLVFALQRVINSSKAFW